MLTLNARKVDKESQAISSSAPPIVTAESHTQRTGLDQQYKYHLSVFILRRSGQIGL